MTGRPGLYAAFFAAFLAVGTFLAAPHRPILVPLPAEWPDPANLILSIFPSGAAYSGDKVSLSAATDSDPGGEKLQVRLDSPAASPLAGADFHRNANSGAWTAQIPWMWDSSAKAGWHTLFVHLAGDPADAQTPPAMVQYPVRILPENLQPELRRNAQWLQAASACCDLFFLSGTESERDIGYLIAETDRIFAELSGRMGGTSARLSLLFLPRMYGQGGLAVQEGVLSYVDRNPTGTDFAVVLEHEMAHLMAIARYGTGIRAPLLLQEGWTVYLTGGHYRTPEPLQDRAAALIRMGEYAPLGGLADSFYSAQHEAAYIEAGAFVEYLAGRFGEERVREMLFDPAAAETPAAALDAMLAGHFRRTLAECETEWLDSLKARTPDPETERDVRFTMEALDAFRTYQRLYAPGSGMFDLWLPDPERARSERISADYLPSPATAESAALELMLWAARESAREKEWDRAWEILDAVDRALAAKQRRVPEPLSTTPLAERYRALVGAILRSGDEPLRIAMRGDLAEVETRDPDNLMKEEQHWRLIRGSWSRGG